MKRVITPLTMMGAEIGSNEGRPPLMIHGGKPLKGINYALPVASAQVKSAILLAGLYASGETFVTEPAVTRDHTERMLKAMGATLSAEGQRIHLAGEQELTAVDIAVPGDLSSAAFLIVAALIAENAEVVLRGVGVNPTRTGVLEILRDMGADILVEEVSVRGDEPRRELTRALIDIAADRSGSRAGFAGHRRISDSVHCGGCRGWRQSLFRVGRIARQGKRPNRGDGARFARVGYHGE